MLGFVLSPGCDPVLIGRLLGILGDRIPWMGASVTGGSV